MLAAWQNTIEVIISDAVYTGRERCGTTRQIPDWKLLRSIYDILTQILNDFQVSLCRVQCRQTLAVAARQWSRCNRVLLTYREKTKQPRHPITGLPRVLSSNGKLIRYLHGSYFLTLSWHHVYTGHERHSATRQNTIEPILLSTLDAVRHDKFPTENYCCVRFMTYWQKFQYIYIYHTKEFPESLVSL